MADKKDKQISQISAAPLAIATNVAPSKEVALKGNTTSRYVAPSKSDKADADFSNAPQKLSEEEIALASYTKRQIMNYGRDLTADLDIWTQTHEAELGEKFDPTDKIDRSFAEFQRANPSDRRITADYEASEYTPNVYNPRIPSSRRSNSPNSIIDDGFKAPTFKLDKQQARTELAADIRTVSEMYAKDAGMSAKDLAKVMGGIATIESRFGVARSVSGTKYASSAGGAFHYLDGTIAGDVRGAMSDPRISNRVAQLGVSLKDGVSKSEAYTMKEDNILAGSVLAKRIVETANENPELRGDVAALAKRVYQAHNLGDAGAARLARGGVDAMNDKEKANNRLFFGGNASDAEVDKRYTKFVAGAIASSDNLIEGAFASTPSAAVTVALNKQQPKVSAPTMTREPA